MPDSVKFTAPPDPRHPIAVFLLALCVFSSIPTFLGAAQPPGSLAATIPRERILIWAAMLTAGAVISLTGTYWRHRVTGLLIEQVGMLFVAVATLYYSGIIFFVVQLNGLQGTSIVLGLGVAAAVRFWQIQRFFNNRKHELAEMGEPPNGSG